MHVHVHIHIYGMLMHTLNRLTSISAFMRFRLCQRTSHKAHLGIIIPYALWEFISQ